MLVLSRKVGEKVVIAGNIQVTVVSVAGDKVRIGIEAPREVTVDREEVHHRRMGAGAEAGAAPPQPAGAPAP